MHLRILLIVSIALLICSCGKKGDDDITKGQLKEYFSTKQVLEKGKGTIETPDGPVEVKEATIKASPQEIIELTSEELDSIHLDAKRAKSFIATYNKVEERDDWTLKDIDNAFAAWVKLESSSKMDEREVLKIVGAAFGEYCVANLKMRWVKVKDQDGLDFAVRSNVKDVMGFPYSTVLKRIESKEAYFMEPVFYAIKNQIESNDSKELDTAKKDGKGL